MSLDFHYVKQDEKSTCAVLLLHGLTGSPFEMRKYAKELHKAGYDIFCHCLPGHGDSEITIKTVKWNHWEEFVTTKYEALKSEYKTVYVSGLCLGAVLSILLAEKYPQIDGVVALSTTLFLDGWTVPWYSFLMPFGIYTILRYYYSFPERYPYGLKNEGIRNRISLLQRKNTVALDHYPMSCIYELLKLSTYVRNNMDKVTAPVLLVHAIEDDITSLKSSDFVYNNISSEQKEYIKLENSYHHVAMDNERNFVFEQAIKFFANIENTSKCNREAVV